MIIIIKNREKKLIELSEKEIGFKFVENAILHTSVKIKNVCFKKVAFKVIIYFSKWF